MHSTGSLNLTGAPLDLRSGIGEINAKDSPLPLSGAAPTPLAPNLSTREMALGEFNVWTAPLHKAVRQKCPRKQATEIDGGQGGVLRGDRLPDNAYQFITKAVNGDYDFMESRSDGKTSLQETFKSLSPALRREVLIAYLGETHTNAEDRKDLVKQGTQGWQAAFYVDGDAGENGERILLSAIQGFNAREKATDSFLGRKLSIPTSTDINYSLTAPLDRPTIGQGESSVRGLGSFLGFSIAGSTHGKKLESFLKSTVPLNGSYKEVGESFKTQGKHIFTTADKAGRAVALFFTKICPIFNIGAGVGFLARVVTTITLLIGLSVVGYSAQIGAMLAMAGVKAAILAAIITVGAAVVTVAAAAFAAAGVTVAGLALAANVTGLALDVLAWVLYPTYCRTEKLSQEFQQFRIESAHRDAVTAAHRELTLKAVQGETVTAEELAAANAARANIEEKTTSRLQYALFFTSKVWNNTFGRIVRGINYARSERAKRLHTPASSSATTSGDSASQPDGSPSLVTGPSSPRSKGAPTVTGA